MSLFNLLFKKPANFSTSAPVESSDLGQADATLPLQGASESRHRESAGGLADRKHERVERRELLYAIVRDSMTRAGVLSAHYKFKVLSLDSRGRQYLIMMDLPQDQAENPARLAEIEGLIAKSAKISHEIVVTAVYWRFNETVTSGLSKSVVPHFAPPPATLAPAKPVVESKLEEELIVYRQARSVASSESGSDVTQRAARAKAAAMFQDTEIQNVPAPLSNTQYGDLN